MPKAELFDFKSNTRIVFYLVKLRMRKGGGPASAVVADFNHYGIDWVLTDSFTRIPDSFRDSVWSVVKESDTILRFQKPHSGQAVRINITKNLSKGAYGQVFEANSPEHKTRFVVKCINLSAFEHRNSISKMDYLYDICTEVLIQMLIYDATKELSFPEFNVLGPFTPKIYYFGTDGLEAFVVSEQLIGNIDDIIIKGASQSVLANCLLQVTKMIDWLFTTLNFSHRDLKTNNILVREIGAKIHVSLIDFGLSCASLNGGKLVLKPFYLPSSRLKFSTSTTRDLHSLLFSVAYLTPYEPNTGIVKICRAIIRSQVPDPARLGNTYGSFNFYNNKEDTRPQNVTSQILINVFKEAGPRWASHLVKLYDGTVNNLTHDELANVDRGVFETYLREKNIDLASDDLLFFFSKTAEFNKIAKLVIVRYGRPEIVNRVNILGNTALITACDKLNLEVVSALLELPNCKTAVQNKEGDTALHKLIKRTNLIKVVDESVMNAGLILQMLVSENPFLLDSKNGAGKAPKDPGFATNELIVHLIVKSRTNIKLTAKRRSNTNKLKGGRKSRKARL